MTVPHCAHGRENAAAQAIQNFARSGFSAPQLARALLTNPTVLLLDEPTNGLDPGAAAEFRSFLRKKMVDELGKTVLLVTHSLEEAHACCDPMAIMDYGKMVFEGNWPALQSYLHAHGFPEQATNDA